MFGNSNNPFGQGMGSSSQFGSQSSIFGQTSNPAAANPFAAKPFGAAVTPFSAQTGSSIFGSTSTGMFGASQNSSPFSSTPAFGSSSPAFGSSVPAFGASSSTTPAFGASSSTTPTFGSSSSAFGASSAFGQTPSFGGFGSNTQTNLFGSSSQPTFSSTSSSMPSFGAGSTPAFNVSSQAFGGASTPAFGTSGTGFGLTNTPFGTGGAFGVPSSSGFGSSTASSFGTPSVSAFGTSSSPAFGAAGTSTFNFSSTPAFGQSGSAFGTTTLGSSQVTQPIGSPVFGQQILGGSRGGSRVSSYSVTMEADGTGQPGKLISIVALPIYKEKSHEELRWEDYQLGDKGGSTVPSQSVSSIGFNATPSQTTQVGASSIFGQTPTSNPFTLGASPGFGSSTTTLLAPTPSSNPFSSSTPFLSSTTSAFSSSSGFGSGSLFGFASTPSLFSSSASSLTTSPFSSAAFKSTPSLFSAPSPSLGQTGSLFGQSTPSSNIFNTSAAAPFSMPSFQSTVSPTFSFSSASASQTAFPSSFTGSLGLSQFPGPTPSPQYSFGVQQPLITNPFGTLNSMSQMSVPAAATIPSVQYGISSMPVVEKPAPVRISAIMTSRHISQGKIRLRARKYYPKDDNQKIPFFDDDRNKTSSSKLESRLTETEYTGNLIASSDHTLQASSVLPSYTRANLHGNGKVEETKARDTVEHSNGTRNEGEAADVQELENDIRALLPKLRSNDYYFEPQLQELAAKERADPGFCRRVKDFVVGRHGYGSIKFIGETDIRRLDLESLVQFNDREVIVYMDESKKPPIGHGLNKPAVVTLLNVAYVDKKTGYRCTEGPKAERFKEILKKKAVEQGAEFISYHPETGEWKFKVNHFSKYVLCLDNTNL